MTIPFRPTHGCLERTVLIQVRTALALQPDIIVWRNNSGVLPGVANPVRFGIGKGSADLIGILRPGRFIAFECKREKGGSISKHQKAWIATVRKWGGLAEVVTSAEQALGFIERARRGEI